MIAIEGPADTLFRKILKVENHIPSKGRGRLSQINRELSEKTQAIAPLEIDHIPSDSSLNTPVNISKDFDFDSEHFKNRQVLEITSTQEPKKRLSLTPPKGLGSLPRTSIYELKKTVRDTLVNQEVTNEAEIVNKETQIDEPEKLPVLQVKLNEAIPTDTNSSATDIIVLDIAKKEEKPYKPPAEIYKVIPATVKNKKTKTYLAQITVKYGLVSISSVSDGNIKFKQSKFTGYFVGPFGTSITFLFSNNNITIPITNIQCWVNVIKTLDDLISNKRCFFPLF